MKKPLEQRIREATREKISIAPYDPAWALAFEAEAEFLRETLPPALIGRVEHFGSTAVPGLAAKPIVDILIEVSSLDETRKRIAPLLESLRYDYFWRTDVDPPYAWFIKRNSNGQRTHHLHFVEADSALWDSLYFRDYLRQSGEEAHRYAELKRRLAETHRNDREAYAKGKTEFIVALTEKAKRYSNET